MQLDIQTLAFILGLLHILQVAVFAQQYATNKLHRGIGWWLAWCIAETAGFACMLLREVPLLRKAALLGQNALIVLGVVFLYIGLMRFLDRKPRVGMVLSTYVLYGLGLVLTSWVHDDLQVRSILLSAGLAGYSFLSAGILIGSRRRTPAVSSGLLTAALVVHGAYFGLRAGMIAGGAPVDPLFVPSLFNVAGLLDGIIMAVMWTIGLILMINRRLNADIAESKEHFEKIFNMGPDATVISGLEDGRILDVNDGFTVQTGYSRLEALGRSALELAIWNDQADRSKIVRMLRQSGACENFETVYRTKAGGRITVLVSAKTIHLRGLPHIISVTHDITARKQAEDRIKALLGEKELLLKEVHHRVKNNLNSMMSLLSLQAGALKNPEASAALREARDRMRGMSTLYDKLYRSENLRAMSIRDYLSPLVDEIVGPSPYRDKVVLEKRIEDIPLEVKTLSSLGIIVNELVTNALKHAFAGREGGRITITAAGREDQVTITVEDDGIGIPESVHVADSPGFGLQLAAMLTAQIDGTLHIERGQGTRFVLEFRR